MICKISLEWRLFTKISEYILKRNRRNLPFCIFFENLELISAIDDVNLVYSENTYKKKKIKEGSFKN